MSDEPSPLSLRLKPRSNPAAATPPSSADSALQADPASPEVPETQAESGGAPTPLADPLKFRLKPKTPPPEGLLAETPIPFSTPPIPVEPVVQSPVAEDPLPPVPVSPAVAVPLAAPPNPPDFRTPPRHIQTPRLGSDQPVKPPTGLPGAPRERTIKADKWLAGIVVLAVVLAAAFFGARFIFRAHPKPKSTAKAPAAPAAEKPAEALPPASQLPGGQTRLVEKPQSAAGKAVARARDIIAAHDQRELTEGATSVLDASAPPAVTSAPTAASAHQSAYVAATSAPREPAVEEASAVKADPVATPSDEFRQFVANLRVNGVFQGENPRAMLNSRMHNVGEVVESKLAITLFKIDVEAKQLVFRDESGAIVSRHY